MREISHVIGYACGVLHLLRTYTIVISVIERGSETERKVDRGDGEGRGTSQSGWLVSWKKPPRS